MERRLHINQDVVAGLMFIVFGAFFLFFGRNYPVGTTLRMGPGYLPQVLGWLLVSIGLLIVAGLVFAMAGSPPVAERLHLPTFHFVNRQVAYLLPALAVMLGASFLSPRMVRRLKRCWLRSPRIAPPVKGDDGSIANTATGDPAERRCAITALVRVLFPAPGAPVSPTV